jgi:hypothetical protein
MVNLHTIMHGILSEDKENSSGEEKDWKDARWTLP